MPWCNELTELRDAAASLYPNMVDGIRIADESGLDGSRIEFHQAAVNNWHAILAEAERRDRVGTVIERIQREFPVGDNPSLDLAVHRYLDHLSRENDRKKPRDAETGRSGFPTQEPIQSDRKLSDDRRRLERRRRFARRIEVMIEQLNSKQEWADDDFTDLEAEVEAEGRRRSRRFLASFTRRRRGLRREVSLSKAIESSAEDLILVEGEPGSGKSVALRHVAIDMAIKAKGSTTAGLPIPIYVNLRECKRQHGESIDAQLIHSFVLRSLNRLNDRDVETFLEDEFDRGLEEGSWFFLFDSFDEQPDILSSTERDDVIRSYTDAIWNFVSGFSRCRGVIASRHFRGPGHLGLPVFRVLPLSSERQQELIRNLVLEPDLEDRILGELPNAKEDIQTASKNPMFLAILCEHVRTNREFPANAYSVFHTYLQHRFIRDEIRLLHRFELSPVELRQTAEKLAFAMSATAHLGLNPDRRMLKQAVAVHNLSVPDDLDRRLDALEFIKVALPDSESQGDRRTFSFAHRRFQEYFTTSFLLSEPQRVSPKDLLSDGRWRETAVVLLQTQELASIDPLIHQARDMIHRFIQQLPSGLIVPPDGISDENNYPGHDDAGIVDPYPHRTPFPWPPGALHLIHLLQEGFGGRINDLPDDIRACTASLLWSAFRHGAHFDKKWALQASGILPEPILLKMLQGGFASQSQQLRDAAYGQVPRLSRVTPDVASGIRRSLVGLVASQRLRKDWHSTKAHLMRLSHPAPFLNTHKLLLSLYIVDVIGLLLLALGGVVFVVGMASASPLLKLGMVAAGIPLMFILRLWLPYWAVLVSGLSGTRPSAGMSETSDFRRNLYSILMWFPLTHPNFVFFFMFFLMVAEARVVAASELGHSLVGPTFWTGNVTTFALSYAMVWPATALLVARFQSDVPPRRWLLAPAVGLIQLFLLFWKSSHREYTVGVLLIGLTGAASIFWLVFQLADWLRRIPHIEIITAAIASALTIFSFISFITESWYPRYKNYRVWNRWLDQYQREGQRPIELHQWIGLITQFRGASSRSFAVRAAEFCYARKVLVVSSSTEHGLQALSMLLDEAQADVDAPEASWLRVEKWLLDEGVRDDELSNMLRQFFDESGVLPRRLGVGFLDEITRLIEQQQAAAEPLEN